MKQNIFQNLEKDSSTHRALAILSSILKHCAREDLKPYSQMLLDKIMKMNLSDNPDALVRKFGLKVIQRIGKDTPRVIPKEKLNLVTLLIINLPSNLRFCSLTS